MDMDRICRMCLISKQPLKSIFKDFTEENLVQTINVVLQFSVNSNDGLPPNICESCVKILNEMYLNIEKFRENDQTLRHMLFGFSQSTKEWNILPEIKSEYSLRNRVKSNDDRVTVEHYDNHSKNIGNIEPETQITTPNEGSVNGSDSDDTSRYKNVPQIKFKNESKKRKSSYIGKQQNNSGHSRPKLNDHKCYICGNSESLGSAKALLEHLTVHLGMMPYTCTECVMEKVVLKNVRSLNVHKKMHAQPIKCEYCDRRYSDYYARDGHVKTYHLGESAPCPSTCEECGKVCKSIAALKSHMRDHKLDVKCERCDKIFHRMSKLREHVKRVHEKAEKYDCSICNHVLHSLESYNSHLKMHNAEKTYVCDLCPMKFYTAGNLGLHKKVHAKNSNYKPHKHWTSHYTVRHDVSSGKVYTCNHCGNYYSGTVNTIISHVKHHFKDIKCDQCNLKFTNTHKLKIHYVVHTRERNYRCEHCGKDFMYSTHLNHHIKNKHRSPGESSSNLLK